MRKPRAGRTVARLSSLVLLIACLGAVTPSLVASAAGRADGGVAGARTHLVHARVIGGGSRAARTAGGTPHLTYYGGPVISNVSVQSVLWGSGTYLPEEKTSAPSLGMDSFFTQVTRSGYVGGLREYETLGAAGGQSIGAGSFAGRRTITPSGAASGAFVQDSAVRSELLTQLQAGHLSAPALDAGGRPNTVYALFFPSGVSVCADVGDCSGANICAYHGSFAATIAGHARHIRYMVLPYPDTSPFSGCTSAVANTGFKVLQSYTSHELAEAITDPDVSLATDMRAPLGWYDPNYGEIADICVDPNGINTDATMTGSDGAQYVVQRIWSNALGACTVTGEAGDRAAPKIVLSRPGHLFQARPTITVGYRASDTGSGVARYDVQYRRASWNGGFGRFTALRSRTSATSVSFSGRPGTEYCIRTRAHDRAGNVSAWTHPRCAVVPLDDRVLARASGGWRGVSSAASYRGTLTKGTSAGSTLRLRGVRTDRIALVATTCPTCGKVAIYLNGVRWRVVDTSSAARHARVVFILPRTRLRTMNVALKVASHRKPVLVDAIAFAHT